MADTTPEPQLDAPNSEVVLAIVAAAGTDVEPITQKLSERLGALGYEMEVIRLSSFLKVLKERVPLATDLLDTPVIDRLRSHMAAGTEARAKTRNDVLALCAIERVKEIRERETGSAIGPAPRMAFCLRTLKNPDEVYTLRKVYGSGFFLIGAYSPEADRVGALSRLDGVPEEAARAVVAIDNDEAKAEGQRTRDTFQLADAFVRVGAGDVREQLNRVLELLFGNPFATPTLDEHAMYLAFASSLRSSDLSRQVGAVVVSESGEVLSVGANDVPRHGGGLYWPGPDDGRDFQRGFDSNERARAELAKDCVAMVDAELTVLFKGPAVEVVPAVARDALRRDIASAIERARLPLMRGPLREVSEFGRAVHAEMEAILSCVRTGRATRGATLYSTTFPCHNCAKHIVCSGLSRVVYVEPYPKSKALALHDDAIAHEDDGGAPPENRVWFSHFVGVGPRRFLDLFSLGIGSGYPQTRKQEGKMADWRVNPNARLRVPLHPTSYLERETIAVQVLVAAVDKGD